jgi:hypothetical protein
MAARMLPPERQVDCACDALLQRPVLHDQSGWNVRVTACMRCGTVTGTRSIIEEPRPHDVRCVGNEVIELLADAIAWLALWPRRAGALWGSGPWLYIAHDVRCETVEELAALEGQLALAPVARRWDRLRAAGTPAAPPPASLPRELESYRQFYEAMSLTDLQPDTLLSTIARAPVTIPVFAELLAADVETDEALARALQGDNELCRAAILVLTVTPGLAGAAVTRAFETMVSGFNSENDEGAGSIVNAIGAMGSRMRALVPALTALAGRIDQQREYYFHRATLQAVARLGGS